VLLAERAFKVRLHQAPLGPIDRRSADLQSRRDHLIGHVVVRRQQDLRAFELAGRVTAAAQQRVKLFPFGLAEFHAILYIHLSLLQQRGTDESQQMNRK